MAGEDARIEIRIAGEDDVFWLDPVVNGFRGYTPIPVESIEHGEALAPELERLVRVLYRTAYRDGFGSCQRVICDALGIKK